MILFQFLRQFYTLPSVWLTCLIALLIYSRSLAFDFRWFVPFVALMGVAETIGNFMAFKGIHNHFYFNFFYIIQFIAVPCFFYGRLHHDFFKKTIRIYLIILPFFILANILWLQNFHNLLTYTFIFGGSFILLLSVAYIRELFTGEETKSIWHYPVFWISLAYLFYYTVAVPYIGMLNYLWLYDPSFTKKYYVVFNIIIILHNIFLITGFLCMKRTTMK